MSDRLVWIDLEMTGLDTVRHTIVEIALLLTLSGAGGRSAQAPVSGSKDLLAVRTTLPVQTA